MQRTGGLTDKGLKAGDAFRFLRCGGIAGAILLVGLVLLFWIAGQHQQEWASARPAGLTDEAWQARRGLCEEAKLGPGECGTMPVAKIELVAGKQREEARVKLCAEDARYDAIENAKKAVSSRLKAPATAEWSNVNSTQRGCDWRVTGLVDAQNAFGGLVRSSFEVSLRRVSKQTWVPISVVVE